jgi:hypothetical protein
MLPRTRQELDEAVFQLHAALPWWRRACGSKERLDAEYRRLFDNVLESASSEDFPYVRSQLDELALASGLGPAFADPVTAERT